MGLLGGEIKREGDQAKLSRYLKNIPQCINAWKFNLICAIFVLILVRKRTNRTRRKLNLIIMVQMGLPLVSHHWQGKISVRLGILFLFLCISGAKVIFSLTIKNCIKNLGLNL